MKRLVSLVAFAVLLAACSTQTAQREPGPGEHRMPDGSIIKNSSMCASSPAGTPRPASTGKLKFLAPKQGSSIARDNVRVRLELTGAHVSHESSGAVTPDAGHIHLALDGRVLTLMAGLDVVLSELPDAEEIASGPHILEAEFVAMDHGVFDPRVIAQVTFTAT